jgi:hypothetical protein
MTKIIILNTISTGVGFGIRVDNNEQVYVPSYAGISKQEGNIAGKELIAKLNPNDHPSSPWKAMWIDWDGKLADQPPSDPHLISVTMPTAPALIGEATPTISPEAYAAALFKQMKEDFGAEYGACEACGWPSHKRYVCAHCNHDG